tara:strand:+ start:115 stop:471 length:357 start_codon:yes stop_codon:yes gene_type:complete
MPDFKGKKRTMAYSKSSGFKMKAAAYGGPMKKNFPSAFKQTDPPTTTSWLQADKDYEDIKSGSRENMARRFSERYGTKITKKPDPKTGVETFSNPDGVSVADLEENFLSSGNFTYTDG